MSNITGRTSPRVVLGRELAEGAGALLGCKKDFIQAKFDFVDRAVGETEKPAEVLDVGCGLVGASRHLAKAFGEAAK